MRRNPWNLLTVRGKVFFFAGLAVLVLAMLLGQRDILLLGLLLALLPVIAVIFMARSKLKLSCERSSDHGQIAIGESVEGRLTLEKTGRMPSGMLLFEEHVPPQLGRRPRFAVNETSGSWTRQVTYPLRGHQRGKFITGPLLVRSTDAFGLARADRQFSATTEIMVTPRVHPLSTMRNVTGGGAAGESRPQRIGISGQDDVLVREYRQGDDVRRIHWRSTARRDEIMVRREEQAWDPSISLILDSRAGAHAGHGPESSFEQAVSFATSIALHFMADGFDLSLFDSRGPMLASAGAQTNQQHVLRCFTEVQTTTASAMTAGLDAAALAQRGQLVVAVVGRLSMGDAQQLLRSRRNRAQGLLVALDVDSYVSRSERADIEVRDEHQEALAMLRQHQWRLVEVKSGMNFAEAWRDLERMGDFT